MPHFAEVILPLALPQNYTYLIPNELLTEIAVGKRVVVQFGKRRLYTALVKSIHQNAPKDFRPKEILEVEDERPIVGEKHLHFWKWLAEYYLCSEGEVMTAALPAGLKLESETIVLKNHLQIIKGEDLNDAEYLVMEALERQDTLSIKEISETTDLKNPLKIIQGLLEKRYILLQEELKSGYRPRQKRMAKLAEKWTGQNLSELFEELKNAPKQKEILLGYFKMMKDGEKNDENPPVSATRLLKLSNASDSSLKGLEEKGIFEIFYDTEILEKESSKNQKINALNDGQQKALDELRHHFDEKDICLLHGVTSSGKTEIYIRFIQEILQKGQQVLYLVPEIALTTQLITRLRKFFGEKVLFYHSRFSDRERVETWLKLVENPDEPFLIIGARSSLFLPVQDLGFVIVDEEHETGFKQHDPAPRYHARDAAMVLSKMFNAKVLLGSATPALETYHNAENGKFGLVKLHKRYADLPLPEIEIIDLKRARKKKEMRGHFSQDLLDEMQDVLKQKKQVILFQNRRGFSTMIQCQNCGHVNQCKNCDITLTYHKFSDLLRCHYCGYTRQIPAKCPACGSYELKSLGFGTEKLEDDLKLQLPAAETQRMDLDSTRKKNAYEKIIENFEEGETDILVGTQMVTKGLDFENVALVGIMNADTLLNFPDFRSHERAYQLMAQVAGRAGRKGKRGKVLIQSGEPEHFIIQKVIENDYEGMYRHQISERQIFHYPPFYKLVRLTLKHKDRAHVSTAANELGKELKNIFGARILGPEPPLVARLRNQYLMEILLKLEEGISLKKSKKLLWETVEKFFQKNDKLKVRVIYDVDPL